MHRFLSAAALLLLTACASFEPAELTPELRAWDAMCRLVETERDYQCGGIVPPKVVYEKMRAGLYGYYDGGDTIYINADLGVEDAFSTLIHEDIHYLHVMLEMIPIPGPAELVCWSENEAWTLEGIYSDSDNSMWWMSYPHCWPYYDPEWEAFKSWFLQWCEIMGIDPVEEWGFDPEEL